MGGGLTLSAKGQIGRSRDEPAIPYYRGRDRRYALLSSSVQPEAEPHIFGLLRRSKLRLITPRRKSGGAEGCGFRSIPGYRI